MLEISENWTPAERLRVIARLNREIAHLSMVRARNCVSEIMECSEKIDFLTSYNSDFLQANKENILDKLT